MVRGADFFHVIRVAANDIGAIEEDEPPIVPLATWNIRRHKWKLLAPTTRNRDGIVRQVAVHLWRVNGQTVNRPGTSRHGVRVVIGPFRPIHHPIPHSPVSVLRIGPELIRVQRGLLGVSTHANLLNLLGHIFIYWQHKVVERSRHGAVSSLQWLDGTNWIGQTPVGIQQRHVMPHRGIRARGCTSRCSSKTELAHGAVQCPSRLTVGGLILPVHRRNIIA